MATDTEIYTHGHHESVLRSHKSRTAENSAGYLLPHLRPGMDVLDVGCGPGTITVDLGRRVAPGRITGIDRSADVVAQAASHASQQSVDARFGEGDVYALDYADASFDVVHAHQVLQHLRDPIAALQEMRRVLRPAGIVAVRGCDRAAAVRDPDAPVPGSPPGSAPSAQRAVTPRRSPRGSPPSSTSCAARHARVAKRGRR